MSKISTWSELVESDIALDENTIEDFVANSNGYAPVVLISRDADERLRLRSGAFIFSVPHQMKHKIVIVIQEGVLKTTEDGTVYLPSTGGYPTHLHHASNLGLAATPHRARSASLCVPLQQELLTQIEFATHPAPLMEWERELLAGK